MKYGILGAGTVACQIADRLVELGHEVMIGSRTADNLRAAKWAGRHESHAWHGTFADAARFGERLFLCVRGIHAAEVMGSIAHESLDGKIIIDQTNPYLYADGHISLDTRWSGASSLGEANQSTQPGARVVKTLNFICSHLMVHPQQLPEAVTGFYCGNDVAAKAEVAHLLADFGWTDTMDLGDISMSRYTEMLGAFWPAVYNSVGHMDWGFKLVR